MQNYNEDEDDLNEDDLGNPFRRRKSASFIKEQSIISQGSIPYDTLGASHPFANPDTIVPVLAVTTNSLEIPRTKDDFAFMQSPSMPEIHGEGTHDSSFNKDPH